MAGSEFIPAGSMGRLIKDDAQWTSFSDEKVLQLMNIGSPVTGTIGCRPIGRTV